MHGMNEYIVFPPTLSESPIGEASMLIRVSTRDWWAGVGRSDEHGTVQCEVAEKVLREAMHRIGIDILNIRSTFLPESSSSPYPSFSGGGVWTAFTRFSLKRWASSGVLANTARAPGLQVCRSSCPLSTPWSKCRCKGNSNRSLDFARKRRVGVPSILPRTF